MASTHFPKRKRKLIYHSSCVLNFISTHLIFEGVENMHFHFSYVFPGKITQVWFLWRFITQHYLIFSLFFITSITCKTRKTKIFCLCTKTFVCIQQCGRIWLPILCEGYCSNACWICRLFLVWRCCWEQLSVCKTLTCEKISWAWYNIYQIMSEWSN